MAPAPRPGQGWVRGVGRAAAAAAVFLTGSVMHNAAFLEHGRGGYRAALDTMFAHGGPVVRVASDHDHPPSAPPLPGSGR